MKGRRNIAIPLRSFSSLLDGSVVEGVVCAAVTLKWNLNWHVVTFNLMLEILVLYLVEALVADLCSTLLNDAFLIHLDSL